MTTQEIKDLIASKIAGQGSAVDAGSALPQILNGIVEALEVLKDSVPKPVEVDGWGPQGTGNVTVAQLSAITHNYINGQSVFTVNGDPYTVVGISGDHIYYAMTIDEGAIEWAEFTTYSE